MTFRLRLIVATTIAVAIAVIVACLASYLSTRDAVERSVDTSLYAAAQGPGGSEGIGESVAGVFYQIVLADGAAYPTSNLPVNGEVHQVATHHRGETLRTIGDGGETYRQLIVPLAAGTILRCGAGECPPLPESAAQVFTVNITGQQHELNLLQLRLLLLALAGVIMAIALGYLTAQAALRPLDSVTNEIENVAETSNVAYRLVEGRNDELGRLRRVFNRLLASVEESQRTQRQLVLDSSHELRTPLTSLRTNAQVLARSAGLTPGEITTIADDMVAQVDELASLITDLTELARGEGIDGTVETIRLDELVDECLASARTHARTRDVEIEARVQPCLVVGRRDRVTRAVNNLLSNAIKFTREGGKVRASLDHGVLDVEDEGPGVAPEDAPYVFDRFWRSPKARALPGSGLGLAIVSQVAAEMGGTVGVSGSSELGGARFTLTLPVIDEPAGAD